MPCGKCGHMLVLLDDEEICPKCNCLAMLDSETSINVATRLVKLTSELFSSELEGWERDTLLGNLAAKRELLSRAYFREYSMLQIGKLANFTLLLKRVTSYSSFKGRTPDRSHDIDKLVDYFEMVNDFEFILSKIRAGYANVLYLRKFKPDSFTLTEAKETFHICNNEIFINFEKTLASHDIFTYETAEKKFEESKQIKENGIDQTEYRLLTPQEFIRKNYEILNQIFAFFNRNKIYAQCFDLEYFEKILNEPRELIKFISTFQLSRDDTLTACPTHKFIRHASNYFEMSKTEIKRLLVFDVNNRFIFPLFIRFRNKDLGDVVCISQGFSRFIYTILHAIMNKEFFDRETVQLSKDFEKQKVKSKFEECGYKYISNVVDKKNATLEIDGLAVKKNKVFIVECKGWRFHSLIDEPETKEHTVRDLKGIVIGEKYTRNGKLIKKKPSMFMKIEFVKSNIDELAAKHGFDPDITSVEGMIVIIDYPPISEYSGVKIYSIHQIPELD